MLASGRGGASIGSMLASVATMAAEFAPDRRRNLILGAVLAGYPIGATLFGLIAADVIPAYGWRSIFMIAGVTTLATLPLVWILLPESLSFLLRVQPFNALTQVNKILRRMDVTPFETLPDIPDEHHQAPSVKNLFHRDRATATTFLWLAFFMNFVALYFLTSWIPKLASAAGLALNLSIYAGAVFNLGAVFGIATSGLISQQLGLKKTIAMFLFLAALSMACFQFSVGSSWVLPVFGLIGFFIQGGFVGLYAVATRLYPTDLRTTGVGWAIGAGRSGAIVGPFLGGIVIAAGVEIGTNFSLFGFVLVLAALCTLRIRSANID